MARNRWPISGEILRNGILEAINSLVQAAKRRARGYRSDRHYIAMIYMTAGKLNFQLPT